MMIEAVENEEGADADGNEDEVEVENFGRIVDGDGDVGVDVDEDYERDDWGANGDGYAMVEVDDGHTARPDEEDLYCCYCYLTMMVPDYAVAFGPETWDGDG